MPAGIGSAVFARWTKSWQWLAAGLLSLLAVFLHSVNWQYAGGLWRDEAAAVRLASLPSLGAIWTQLEHESFPLLITMLLRGWNALGLGASDPTLRGLGLLIGLAILAALWWNAWRLSSSPPLLSLLLFGLSPMVIRWGDSLRAYGIGAFLILLTLAAVWSVVRSPNRANVCLALIAGILSVQALYQNSFVLAALCLSGALVTSRRGNFKRAALILALAVPAALSLLPYLGVIRRANQWNVVTQAPLDLARIGTVLHRALSDPGPLLFWLWIGALVLALAAAIALIARRKDDSEETDLAWFLLGVMVLTTVGYFIFLKLAKFPTEVWYYLVWMSVMAVAIDALVARTARANWLRGALCLIVVAAAAFMNGGARQRLQERMTNLDLVAQRLNQAVAPGDLVLVHPWFCGATFHRYYAGSAPWMTLPPLKNSGLQRLDLFKEQLQIEDPIEPVLAAMEDVLRRGDSVWLVGYFLFLDPPQPAPQLSRPGEGPEGWREEPYMVAYGMQATYFIQNNALRGDLVDIPLEQKVNPFENLPVRAVSGWRSRY